MIIWTFFLFLAAGFLTLPRNPLLNDDAALYALMAKNAIVHNQWLVQFITPGDPASFLDKPPLGIWLLAWLPKLTGVNELTIHLPNVLYYCLLLGLLYWLISKLASKELALNTTLIAATSLALVVYSRTPKLDVPLTIFVALANLAFFAFLQKGKSLWLYLFALSLAGGFLVKSGFGLILPGLTILGLLIADPEARRKLLKTLFSWPAIIALIILLAPIILVVAGQATALGAQFIPYLKSLTIQSKYNTSYLGFGFNYSIILLLLITIFPWTPLLIQALAPSSANAKESHLLPEGEGASSDKGQYPLPLGEGENVLVSRVRAFAAVWFWSNFLFFLFFYKQTDFRTFTVLVPPLAILAASNLGKPATEPLDVSRGKRRGFQFSVNLFFLFVFAAALIILLKSPLNAQGVNVSAAILPIGLFTFSLILLSWYFLNPSSLSFSLSFALICLSYVVLFWNTLPLANSFNPDVAWPKIIQDHRITGSAFYIYRPPDRNLFYSPDLFYADFMAGPADRYFWRADQLKTALAKEKALVLSDTKSWEKLKIGGAKVLAQDNYSTLRQISGIIK